MKINSEFGSLRQRSTSGALEHYVFGVGPDDVEGLPRKSLIAVDHST